MSKYTVTIKEIIEVLEDNIFDFTYSRSNEAKAIVSDEVLQQDFIDHYYLREIGQETTERFKHYFKVQWKESLLDFDKLLVAYNKEIDPLTNFGGTTEYTGISNDTPMNALDFGAESNHASFIQNNKSNNKGYSNKSQIELLEEYHDKLKDIETEFIESFDNLFMQVF